MFKSKCTRYKQGKEILRLPLDEMQKFSNDVLNEVSGVN
jgi:hypothetical protein